MSAPSRTLVLSTALVLGSLGLTSPATAGTAPARAAASTTSLALTPTTSDYGQTVTATATVAVAAGLPQGDVYFSVDGVAWKTNLGASGTATMVLPDAGVGPHAVSATFVPQLPAEQQGSTSPTQPWTVDRARTRMEVRVRGRGARIPTSVRVRTDGEWGSHPTGRLRVTVQRAGGSGRRAESVRLTPDGVSTVPFGTLRKGRYRVAVTYRGDAQHLPATRTQWFHVRKR